MIRLACLCLLLLPTLSNAACRQALALGLDVSGSVDEFEYRLQMDGVATALNSAAVQEVLFAQPDAPIRITVFEWSSPNDLKIVQPWITLNSPADLAIATAAMNNHGRRIKQATTAIGSALEAGFAMLATQQECWRRTLDLSGDGKSNTGPRPQDISDADMPDGTVVNGLVIGSGDVNAGDDRFVDVKELSSYYEAYVIRGPGAFVEVALGFETYAAAMERKLLRELQSIAIGQNMHGPEMP
ncbi:DUF1194 domain-containing protein [Yoonia sp. SS1-5]|uniref:DUF1194 domain-containing protein n=1 Tax=Yoonia rhodophyticola TaxID=3137370 RepID=A0AAN0NKL2_9RHOB